MRRRVFGALAGLVALPVAAHHSFAMFDLQRRVTLIGTVKEFQFNNPHCFIQLAVPDGNIIEEWSIEMGAPAHLLRQGWTVGALKRGDKITVVINPLRDGGKGGNYVSAVAVDGTPVGGRS